MKQAPYSHAYLQTPSYNKEKDILIFSTDDDLWRTSLQSNSATFRLTHSKGSASDPFINHDGSLIAYLDTYSGQKDIYLVATEGGLSKRITFKGVQKICGWKDKKTLIYTSNAHSFSQRVTYLYSIHIETLEIKDLNLGHASALSTLKNLRVLGRNTGDPARWKRYRGGTAGTLWLESTEGKTKGEFKQILKSLKDKKDKDYNCECILIFDSKGNEVYRDEETIHYDFWGYMEDYNLGFKIKRTPEED